MKLGYLVEFSSMEEQQKVVNYLQDSDRSDVFWLGGRDINNEGNECFTLIE